MGRLKKRFECEHYGFGKYCHACKDAKAGKGTPKKAKKAEAEAAAAAPKRYWSRPKCPFCNGSWVKHNELNVMSALDAKEFTCTSYSCGKSFDIDRVKEFEQVEVKPRAKDQPSSPAPQ